MTGSGSGVPFPTDAEDIAPLPWVRIVFGEDVSDILAGLDAGGDGEISGDIETLVRFFEVCYLRAVPVTDQIILTR